MPPSDKERLDALVQRIANVSRSVAQGLIQTGQVFGSDGGRLDKPGMRLPADTPIEIRSRPRFVSRGGDKLEAAFAAFPIEVAGRTAIDAGASTGGFTDCLLQHGAERVYAVDVGYGQLAWSLRQDPRVVVMERRNIRNLAPDLFPDPPTFFTADCSFISLRLILPPLLAVMTGPIEGVALIKPQFEAGPDQVGKGGVVRDESVHARVIDEVSACARALGFAKIDVIPSPLLGPAGNREFLAWMHGFSSGG